VSQDTGLTPPQARVLQRLEAVFPHYRSAAELAAELGMDARSALGALQALVGRGYARRGPLRPGATDEADIYQATTKPR
jgi:DNA-binding MarR family transcriptional regulator